MKDKNCQYEQPTSISVQEQPSVVDYLTKKLLSVDANAKLVMKDKNCQYEPSSPISVQEQPSDVEYLNKKLLFVDTNAKLVMKDKNCQYKPSSPNICIKNSLLKLTI